MAAALICVLPREKADEGVGRGPGGPPHKAAEPQPNAGYQAAVTIVAAS